MKKCIIVANGKSPRKNIILYFKKKNYSTLICADGGANSLKNIKVVPDYIIGDLDSILPDTIKYFEKKSKIIKIKRQNDTDVEKCLKFAIKNKFTETILLGVTGDRLDHTFCNLGIVLKFSDKINIKLIAENSILIPYSKNITLNTEKGETISLYGFNKKTKISSSGLKYPLKNTALPFGEKESTSNVAVSDKVDLNIKGGKIFVIRDLNTIKKYDLL